MSTLIHPYETMLAPYLAPGFVYREIVNEAARDKMLPPAAMRSRLIRPLQLANELRAMMMKRGASGLLCAAAFRPQGGAGGSQHKFNRALDLDLLPKDYGLARAFAEEAVRLWCEYGHNEKIGIGLYGRIKSCATIRVHVDVGHRTRGWQIVGGKEYGVKASDITRIAKEHGLEMPV